MEATIIKRNRLISSALLILKKYWCLFVTAGLRLAKLHPKLIGLKKVI
jgi:hypothetical protein